MSAKTCSGLETTPNDHDLRLEYQEFTWRLRDNDEAGSVFDEPYERYLDSEDGRTAVAIEPHAPIGGPRRHVGGHDDCGIHRHPGHPYCPIPGFPDMIGHSEEKKCHDG
ncbi:hypothetical protein HEP84_01515 [Streptomyces sp. RLB1-33]|nr:hypothetical protein [Streptomyces sp. RLB1-33]QIY68166.1 hypothetical protein HEP84_01515 [Streptomyces sp. RLB1-33]